LGHSAGAQFLDRIAAFVPTDARRIVIANAGSYVFPSLAVDAPYGLGKVYSGTDGEAALRRYLEQPLTIYLGQGDTRDDERNDYPEALAQGASRYQRGVRIQRGEDAGTGPRLEVQLAFGRTARRGTQRTQDVLGAAGVGGIVALNRRWDACDS